MKKSPAEFLEESLGEIYKQSLEIFQKEPLLELEEKYSKIIHEEFFETVGNI